MKIKKKRLIALKNPRLRKIRTELRNLLKKAFNDHYSRYFKQEDAIRNDSSLSYDEKKKKCTEIENRSEKFYIAFIHSLIGCRLCGKTDLDLVYNPILDTWYYE